jgi:hypothetical protein
MSWERSAAATQVLLSSRARPNDLLPLAYKELVLRGSLSITPKERRFGKPLPWLTVNPAVPLPLELARLDAHVRRLAPEGGSVRGVIQKVGQREPSVGSALKNDVLQLLEKDALVTQQRRFLRPTRILLTEEGTQVRDAFRELRDPSEPAVLLLHSGPSIPEIDRALRDILGGVDGAAFNSSFDSACHDGGAGGHDGGGGGHH